MARTYENVHCSFCGKHQKDAYKLIAGSNVYICDACISLCIEILIDETNKDKAQITKYLPALSKLSQISVRKDVDLWELGLAPRFKRVRFRKRRKYCFYLCPFADPFNTIYSDHAKPAIERTGFKVERADEIFGTQPIIEDIWEGINSSEIVVADVTNRNPNVMHEIGMAHTVGIPVVIITQNTDDVPFDLKHHRCILYSYTPKGCAALEEKLSGTLRFVTGSKSFAK
jgi:hypothetical protein